jgi:hypothetical protein
MAAKDEIQQENKMSSDVKLHIGNLNARFTTITLAISDLAKEIDYTLKTMTTITSELQKENEYLKTKTVSKS